MAGRVPRAHPALPQTGHSRNLHALKGQTDGPGTFKNLRPGEDPREERQELGVWQGWGFSLGPGPLRHAPGACSRSWGPLPGIVYLTVHTLGPQGVTQPCSPHSSSATQPVGPPQP